MKTLFWIYRSRVDKLGQSLIMLRLIIANEIKNISTGVKVIRNIEGPIAMLPCASLNFYERCGLIAMRKMVDYTPLWCW